MIMIIFSVSHKTLNIVSYKKKKGKYVIERFIRSTYITGSISNLRQRNYIKM